MTSVATVALAAALAAIFSALVRRLRWPAAVPVANRWHRTVTPATGGIALFGAFVLALQPPLHTGAIGSRYVPVIIIAGAAFALGLWDDIRKLTVPLKVPEKLVGQLAIGFAAAAYGVRPDWLAPSVGIPVACLVIVGCMNSLNLIDNMDGLAAGTAAVAAFGLAMLGGIVPSTGSPVVAAALAGTCVGFLPFNYRPRRPAALFMGDSGSQLLGFTLGALALLASPGGAGGIAAQIVAPLLILAVPVLDTGLVMLVRIIEKRPVWQGGLDHSSHRLVYRGLTERRAVAVLLAITVGCTATAITLVIFENIWLTAVASGMTLVALAAFGARLAGLTDVGIGRRPKMLFRSARQAASSASQEAAPLRGFRRWRTFGRPKTARNRRPSDA